MNELAARGTRSHPRHVIPAALLVRLQAPVLTVLAFEKGKAMRYPFYPGLTFQHAVQAIARDLLANGMNRVEAAGYPVVMSIHDEVICEIPDGTGDVDAFSEILCEIPKWAEGIPLLAEGWSGQRYRKAA